MRIIYLVKKPGTDHTLFLHTFSVSACICTVSQLASVTVANDWQNNRPLVICIPTDDSFGSETGVNTHLGICWGCSAEGRRFGQSISSIYSYSNIYKESGDSPQCETKYEEKCETKYDTVQEQKCETVYDNKCNTVQEQKCETRYEDKCETKGGQSHRFPSIFRTLAYVKKIRRQRVKNHWKVSTSI